MYRLLAFYFLAEMTFCSIGFADELPTNPWLNTAPETYTIHREYSESVSDTPTEATARQPAVINVNFNILMNFFASPFQKNPNTTYRQNSAMTNFLNNIGRNERSPRQTKTQDYPTAVSNPIDNATKVYNHYVENMRKKYNNTKQSVENYYYDKINTLKDFQNSTTQNIQKLMK